MGASVFDIVREVEEIDRESPMETIIEREKVLKNAFEMDKETAAQAALQLAKREYFRTKDILPAIRLEGVSGPCVPLCCMDWYMHMAFFQGNKRKETVNLVREMRDGVPEDCDAYKIFSADYNYYREEMPGIRFLRILENPLNIFQYMMDGS